MYLCDSLINIGLHYQTLRSMTEIQVCFYYYIFNVKHSARLIARLVELGLDCSPTMFPELHVNYLQNCMW